MNPFEPILLLSAISATCAYLCRERLGQVECRSGKETCVFIQMQWKCMSCEYTQTHCHTHAMVEDCRPYCDNMMKDQLIEVLNNTILILTGEREHLRMELEAQKQSAQRDCCFVLCLLPILVGVIIGMVSLLSVFAVIKCCRKKCKGRLKRSRDDGSSQKLRKVTVHKLNTANPADNQVPEMENKSTEESQPDSHGGFLNFKVDQKDPLKAVNPENHDLNNERTVLLPTGAIVREDHTN